jgi:gamma-glutamyl:cysteine ligase YbdK (ATP-grasp superfamily)
MALKNKYASFPLFSAVGIEIEYMIVNKETLNILPIADKILEYLSGKLTSEVSLGEISLSNELVSHVIEFKTNHPTTFNDHLSQAFHQATKKVNDYLENHNAMLLPTGMHPWFNPKEGVQLWPHGDKKIYNTYDRIFKCNGHGWGNLQSTHINLPFANDEEFRKLHNAIRIILPLIPALTASSPFVEGQKSNAIDTRLYYYMDNQANIPNIAGDIIPEYIESIDAYQKSILEKMYVDISAYDPEKILQHEWLNSRGAIARFERMTIEIRLLDTQESPLLDVTIAFFIQQLIKYLIDNTEAYLYRPLSTQQLKEIFLNCVEKGSQAEISDPTLLSQLGFDRSESLTAQSLWLMLLDKLDSSYFPNPPRKLLTQLIQSGNLSERLLKAANGNFSPPRIFELYQKLSRCLQKNEFFIP